MDKEWREEFDSRSVKEEEFDREEDNAIETEAAQEMDDGMVRVSKQSAWLEESSRSTSLTDSSSLRGRIGSSARKKCPSSSRRPRMMSCE